MAIKGTRATQIANDTNVSPVKFNFKTYDGTYTTFYNNPENIDFVTWNGNLYVTVNDGTEYVAGDPAEHGFLLVVAKGEDGEMGATGDQGPAGHAPRITAKFEGNQVTIYADGVRIAATNDLTPPSWKPELEGHTIVWSKTKDDTTPRPIDLDLLRPVDTNPVLFRVDSDNTKRDDEESGPAKFIQWQYEGEEYWRNLISIDELMNVALAGISFWPEEENGESYWHFGHREVISATYDIKEEGGKQIANVELGEVLFDAGRIPFANYRPEFDELTRRINELESAWQNYTPNLEGYLTENGARNIFATLDDVRSRLTKNDADGYYQEKGDYLNNLEFRVSGETNRLLQYHYKTGSSWSEWFTITELTENNNNEDNYVSNVQVSGNTMTFTWHTGRTLDVTLPGGTGNEGIDADTVRSMINNALQGYARNNEVVKSVTVNNVTGTPDQNGNVSITIPTGTGGSGSTVSLSNVLTSGTKIADITINNSTTSLYAPNNGGNGGGIQTVTLDLQLGGTNGRTLQYKLSTDGSGSWQNGPELPAGGNADLSNIKLQIRTDNNTGKKYLEISRDGGTTWEDPLELPAGGSGSGLTQSEVETIINNALSDYALKTWVQNYTYDKSTIDNKIAAVGTGGTGGTSETIHTFTLYQRNNIEDDGIHRPTKPSSADFTWDGRSMLLTDLNAGTAQASPWLNSPENQDTTNGKIYLWVTMATYSSINGISSEGWSNPVCLTGRNGADGEDGKFREFVYILTEDDTPPGLDQYYGCVPANMTVNGEKAYTMQPSGNMSSNDFHNQYDFLPYTSNRLPTIITPMGWPNGKFPIDSWTGWTDNPQGIDEDYPYEWVSFRTISYENGNDNPTFSEFSDPVIWSSWGEDGVDGDGVEYIYYVTPENNSQTTYYSFDQTTNAYVLERGIGNVWPPTTPQEIANISNYQEDDWYPGNTQQGTSWDRNWTDNPLGIRADRPYEWVAVRKKVDGVWQPFSAPSLWARFGKDGASTSIYTSYIFTRTDTDISSFILSDDISPQDVKTYTSLANKQNNIEYTYGNNQHLVWHDSVPSNSTETVWMSMNIINDTSWDQGWTSPVILSDSDTFQVEYCASESIAKALPPLNNSVYIDPTQIHGINETTLRAYMRNTHNEEWGDENDITDPVWMATASKVNGVWTNWAYARIKGEKGEAGTSVKIVNTVEYAVDLSAFAPNLGTSNAAAVGDCFIVLSGTWDGLSPASVPGHITATNYTRSHLWTCTGEVGNQADFTNIDMYGFHDLGEFGSVDPNSVFVKFAKDATNSEIQNAPNATTAQIPVFINNQYVNTYITLISNDAAGPYIGVYTGQTASTDVRDYTWTKWNGEDGYGMEQIFIKMPEGETPVRPTKALIPTTQNPLTNSTRITGFKTLQAGTWSTSGNAVTEANYMKPDYLPVVMVYTNGVSSTQEWFDTPQEIYDNSNIKYDCWQCTRNKNTDPTLQWSAPTRYYKHVENGTDGKDGKFEESVYILTEDDTPPDLYETAGCVAVGLHTSGKTAYSIRTGNTANQILDFLPSDVANPSRPPIPIGQTWPNNTFPIDSWSGWRDNPQGVDEDYPYEWIATRQITYEDANNPHTPTFGAFSEPSVWSHFGEDGRDGDGLEYVFFALTTAEHEYIQTRNTNNGKLVVSNSSISGDSLHGDPSKSEFYPNSETLTVNGSSRTIRAVDDNPGITTTYPYVYAATRKFIGGKPGHWDSFGYAVYWNGGKDGQNGATPKELYSLGTDNAPSTTFQNSWATTGATVATLTTAGWLENVPSTTSNNNCVWATKAYIIVGQESSSYVWTNPYRIIKDGQSVVTYQYLNGVVMRLSAWEDGTTGTTKYWNGVSPILDNNGTEYANTNTSEGIKYMDVVSYQVLKQDGTYKTVWYKCVTNHTKRSNPPTNNSESAYWSEFAMMGDAAFQNLLVENAAYIKSLTSKQVVITDTTNNVTKIVAGMTSGNITGTDLDGEVNPNGIRIWAGETASGSNGDLTTTPFNVDHEGVLHATKGYFGGPDGIVIDPNDGKIRFGSDVIVNIPTSTSQGYTIAVLGSSMLATPVVNNNNTTYSVSGSIVYALYNNGTKITTQDNNCKVYLSGTGNALSPTFSNGTYTISSITGSGLNNSQLFVQIIWYGDSDGNTVRNGIVVPIAVKGDQGNQGSPGSSSVQTLTGPIMRLRDWENNTDYCDGTTPITGESILYLDVVKVTERVTINSQPVDQINYYKCVHTHKSSASPATFATDKAVTSPNILWQEYALIGDGAFNTLIANSGLINNLTAKQVVITKTESNQEVIKAGLTSSSAIPSLSIPKEGSGTVSTNTSNVVFWAGTPTGADINTAPLTIDDAGNLKATGNITANKIIATEGNSQVSVAIKFGNVGMTTSDNNTIYFLY